MHNVAKRLQGHLTLTVLTLPRRVRFRYFRPLAWTDSTMRQFSFLFVFGFRMGQTFSAVIVYLNDCETENALRVAVIICEEPPCFAHKARHINTNPNGSDYGIDFVFKGERFHDLETEKPRSPDRGFLCAFLLPSSLPVAECERYRFAFPCYQGRR